MAKICSTCVTFAIILTTVITDQNVTRALLIPNENVTKELPNLNENVTNEMPNSNENVTKELPNSNENVTKPPNSYEYITIELPSTNESATKDLLKILNKSLNEHENSIIKMEMEYYVDPETEKVWKMYLAEKKARFKEKLRTTTAMVQEDAVTQRSQKGSEEFNPSDNLIENNKINEEKAFPENGILELVPILDGKKNIVNDTGRNITRRQKKMSKHAKLLIKMAEFAGSAKAKYERYREPYWKSGEYVFLRTGSPITTPTTPVTYTGTRPTIPPMEAFRDCDRLCSHYYKTYGTVCGHRLNTREWKNQYKNFDNICDMDHENCVSPISRPHWHPMYKGECGELGTFYQPPFDYHFVTGNAKKWDPYVYVPPTTTMATVDPIDEELKNALKETEAEAKAAKG